MAIRLLRFEGDPILNKKARPVKEVNDKIRAILDDMVETMHESSGIGLAGPQIGKLRRYIVVDVGDGIYKMINPEIIEKSEENNIDIEGCLSLPMFNGTVKRPNKIKVKYTDENGEDQEIEAEGLFARCICHEVDHLNGILFRSKVEREIDLQHPTEEQIKYLKEKGIIKDQDNSEEEEPEKEKVQEEK